MSFDREGFDREVGLRLNRARRSRGITQEELAKRIGIPRASYANIESGRQRISIDVIWRAAVVLEVAIASLVPEPVNRARHLAPVVSITARPMIVPATAASNSLSPTRRRGSVAFVGTSTDLLPISVDED